MTRQAGRPMHNAAQAIVPRGGDTPGNGDIVVSAYSTALPPSSEVERYEALLPGTVNRVITMIEKDQAAAIAADERQQREESIARFMGILIAAMVAGGSLAVYREVALAGKSTSNLALVITSLAAIPTAFIAKSAVTQILEKRKAPPTKPR